MKPLKDLTNQPPNHFMILLSDDPVVQQRPHPPTRAGRYSLVPECLSATDMIQYDTHEYPQFFI